MRTLPTFWLRTLLSKHCRHSCPPVTSLLQACLSSSVPVWQRNARLCGGFDRWLQGLGWDHIALVCLSAPSPTCNKGIKQGGEQPYMLAFWQCLKYRWKPAFSSFYPGSWGDWLTGEVCQGDQLSSLAGCSVSAGLSVLGASAETANKGTD